MAFAAHFYYLINSIVLLAPAGILRRMPDDYESIFFRFSSLVPYTYLRTLVGKLLGVDLSGRSSSLETRQTVDDPRLEIPKRLAPVSKDSLDVGAMVQWQFDYHKGFVHSFIDTILHGPLMNQQSDWHKAAAVIKGKDVATSMQKRSSKLYNSKILVIFGDADSIVAEKEVSEDIAQLLGSPDHVTFKTVPGGHGFPVPSCNEVVNHICEFWEL